MCDIQQTHHSHRVHQAVGCNANYILAMLVRKTIPAMTSDGKYSNTLMQFSASRDKEVHSIIYSQELIFIKVMAKINR